MCAASTHLLHHVVPKDIRDKHDHVWTKLLKHSRRVTRPPSLQLHLDEAAAVLVKCKLTYMIADAR